MHIKQMKMNNKQIYPNSNLHRVIPPKGNVFKTLHHHQQLRNTPSLKVFSAHPSNPNRLKLANREKSKSNENLNKHIEAVQTKILQSPIEKPGELFEESFVKIQQIKAKLASYNNHELSQQVDDIIDLIKGERVRGKVVLEELTHQPLLSEQSEQGVSTGDLKYQQKPLNIKTTATQTDEHLSQIDQSKIDAYLKLVSMLEQISINYLDILPQLPNFSFSSHLHKSYKQLTNQEIIKLQECLIKKLKLQIEGTQKKKTASNLEKNNPETP